MCCTALNTISQCWSYCIAVIFLSPAHYCLWLVRPTNHTWMCFSSKRPPSPRINDQSPKHLTIPSAVCMLLEVDKWRPAYKRSCDVSWWLEHRFRHVAQAKVRQQCGYRGGGGGCRPAPQLAADLQATCAFLQASNARHLWPHTHTHTHSARGQSAHGQSDAPGDFLLTGTVLAPFRPHLLRGAPSYYWTRPAACTRDDNVTRSCNSCTCRTV